MISSLSLFKNYQCCACQMENFLWITVSAADAVAVNPSGIKILLANGLSLFFINGKTVFNNGPRSPPRIPPDCIILDSWHFDSLILADKLLANAIGSFETCLHLILIHVEN